MSTYTATVVNFKCVDESGWDRFGSDEPYWIFSALDESNGATSVMRSRVFGNVDSGDTKAFTTGPESVVWPAQGKTQGAPGPIALSIQLWEEDQGNADSTRKKTEAAIAGLNAVTANVWVAGVSLLVKDQLVKFIADDIMGSHTVYVSQKRLDQRLPSPGSSYTDKIRFSGSSGDLPWGLGGSPDYDLVIRYDRVS